MPEEKGQTISADILYTEGCATFRHYSTASMTIRVLSVVQALVIISGVGILIQSNLYSKSVFGSIFGFFFTIVLYRLHSAYFNNAIELIQHLANVERERDNLRIGGMMPLEEARKSRLRSIWQEKLAVHGPYIFFGAVFFFLTLYSVIRSLF